MKQEEKLTLLSKIEDLRIFIQSIPVEAGKDIACKGFPEIWEVFKTTKEEIKVLACTLDQIIEELKVFGKVIEPDRVAFELKKKRVKSYIDGNYTFYYLEKRVWGFEKEHVLPF